MARKPPWPENAVQAPICVFWWLADKTVGVGVWALRKLG